MVLDTTVLLAHVLKHLLVQRVQHGLHLQGKSRTQAGNPLRLATDVYYTCCYTCSYCMSSWERLRAHRLFNLLASEWTNFHNACTHAATKTTLPFTWVIHKSVLGEGATSMQCLAHCTLLDVPC
jgi:hypothetical protein